MSRFFVQLVKINAEKATAKSDCTSYAMSYHPVQLKISEDRIL